MAAVFVALTLYGTARLWHPLPYWDMWNGYAGFFFEVQDGQAGAWLAQHNEHRILLARLFFWLDLAVFRGAGWTLIVANLLALAGIGALLLGALQERTRRVGGRLGERLFWLSAFPLVALVFWWSQWENLFWGFQIQFFLAILLPLASFLALGRAADARAADPRGADRLFALGAALAALSPWALSSGLLAPFVATVAAAILRSGRWRVALLGAIAAGSAAAYLWGYRSVGGHSDPVASLLGSPLAVARYVLAYLGAPATFVTGRVTPALVAGGVFLVGALVALVVAWRRPERQGVEIALVAFVAQIVVMAGITGLGRLKFGLVQALSSRYETPVLVAWAALAVLTMPALARVVTRGRPWRLGVIALVAAVPFAQLPYEIQALDARPLVRANRDAATIALALGVADPATVAAVFPTPALPVDLAARLRSERLTILGREPYLGLTARLGSTPPGVPTVTCSGRVEVRTPVEGSPYDRVTGWVDTAGGLGATSPVAVLDADGRIVGWVALGRPRPDLPVGGGPGFVGYLLRDAPAGGLTVAGDVSRCGSALLA